MAARYQEQESSDTFFGNLFDNEKTQDEVGPPESSTTHPPSSTRPPPTQRPTPSLPTDSLPTSSPATSTPSAPMPPPSPPLFPLPASVYSPPSTRPEGPGYQDPEPRSEFALALNPYNGAPGNQAPPPTPRGSPLPEGVISSHQVP